MKEFEQHICQNMLAISEIVEKTLLEVGNKFNAADLAGWKEYQLAHISQKRVTKILSQLNAMLEGKAPEF